MIDGTAECKRLEDLTLRFTEAFNRDDLDGVMAMMTEDAIYAEFTGTVPQSGGDSRRVRAPVPRRLRQGPLPH